jgi:hypothetical protein
VAFLMGVAFVYYLYQGGWFQPFAQLANLIPLAEPPMDPEELEDAAIEREIFGGEDADSDSDEDDGEGDGDGGDGVRAAIGGEEALVLEGHPPPLQQRGGTLYNVEKFIVGLFASLVPGRYEYERV